MQAQIRILEGETATFEEVVVESPQIQESFEMISVGPENQEEDKVDDSESSR